jgi:hypothetical protein
MANHIQSSIDHYNNNNHNNKGLDVHTDKNNNSYKQQVELASSLKKNQKYTSTPTTSSSTTTTLASPTTNPPLPNTIIHRMANYTAILDTAATGNYVTTSCPVTNQQPTQHGVDVILPDGSSITSTHTALLQLPHILPIGARTAHIFPGLKSGSLISIGQLCDHGCSATFDSTQVRIHYQDKIIMTGTRSHVTNHLWILELDDAPISYPSNEPQDILEPSIGTANNLMSYDTIAERIAFYHASLFSPVISTWCDAIDNGHFTTWPELSSAQVRKYLPHGSGPMIKGHLHQQRANLRSTKPKEHTAEQSPIHKEDFAPSSPLTHPPAARTHFVFVQCERISGKTYSDQTGKFIAPSATGMNYILVLYEFDGNSIHAEPIKNRTAGEIKRAYALIVKLLQSRGLHPKLQFLDNEASEILIDFITSEGIDHQLAPPHMHRRNAAERAISTFKDHFIAGLSSTDPAFPLTLWDKLIAQSVLTLNLLRRSRINPQLSAYAQVFGAFDFNKTPLAPPGTRVLVHEKPDVRQSWDPRAIDAWYIGPAMTHYRCYRVYVWGTNSERVADTLAWFPTRVKMPTMSSLDLALAAAKDLLHALIHPSPGSPLAPTTDSQTAALKQLVEIFADCTHRSSLLSPQPSATTKDVLENSQESAGADPRVHPSNAPTPAPLPPGFTQVHQAPPTTTATSPRVPTISSPPSNSPAPVPRVPVQQPPHPATPTYDNTAIGSTRRRTRKTAKPKTPPTTPTVVPAPVHVANSIHVRQALDQVLPDPTTTPSVHLSDIELAMPKGYALGIICPITGENQEYRQLIQGPDAAKWIQGCTNELGRLLHGIDPLKDGPSGTDTIQFIRHDAIPQGKKATYLRIVVDIRPQKEETHRVRFTCGGDKITYPGNVSTPTSDLTTIKTLLNSTISTKGAKCLSLDLKDFYLNNIMPCLEYMRIPLWAIPKIIMDNYNLWPLVHNGFVTCAIRKGMYGLPQAGRIAYDALVAHLESYGYYPAPHTPGLWLHKTRPTIFTLVVDDFLVKYMSLDDANHLISALKVKYTIAEDWQASLYTGLTIDWDYDNGTVDISMPGYIEKALKRFQHPFPSVPEDAPSPWEPPKYGAKVQFAELPDTTTPLTPAATKRLQEIIGTFLFIARAVDCTMLVALGTLASQQAHGTEATIEAVTQLLNYAATHPDPVVRFKTSEMQLEIASDASYLSETKARSRAGGYFYLSNKRPNPASPPKPGDPLPDNNGPIHVHCSIMPMVVSSAAEAEVGGCYYNAKDATVIRTALEEMGHPQPPTPIECDNTTGVGILNDTIRQRRSKAMDMRFYWIKDRQKQGQYHIYWGPGNTNRSDYFTKHHSPAHHRIMRPHYLHEPTQADRDKRRRGKMKYTLASTIVVEKPQEDSLLARFWRGCVDPKIRVTRNGSRHTGHPGVAPPSPGLSKFLSYLIN